jgi:hypothetical protein
MDIQALLNSIASGPPPSLPQGVSRVPIPQINLGGIGPVPVPPVPIESPPPRVVPGQPLPAGVGGIGGRLGDLVPGAAGGAGTIMGSMTGPTPTAQVTGPRGDRTFIANMPTPTGHGGTGAPGSNWQKLTGEQLPGTTPEAPTPVQQHMAANLPQQPIHQQNAQMLDLINQLQRPPASAALVPRTPVPARRPSTLGALIEPRRNA